MLTGSGTSVGVPFVGGFSFLRFVSFLVEEGRRLETLRGEHYLGFVFLSSPPQKADEEMEGWVGRCSLISD